MRSGEIYESYQGTRFTVLKVYDDGVFDVLVEKENQEPYSTKISLKAKNIFLKLYEKVN